MRILLTGADQALGQALITRLQPSHELLIRDDSSSREIVGCQALIHLWSAATEGIEASARAAGVEHILRVVPWAGPADPAPGCCIVRTAPLMGPGDPEAVIQGWLSWALQDPQEGAGRAVLVDHRDALGGIESALWKGRAGAVYPLIGANPTWSALGAQLRSIWTGPAPGAGPWAVPGEDAGQIGTDSSEADLGWWHRSLEQSLRDTVARL